MTDEPTLLQQAMRAVDVATRPRVKTAEELTRERQSTHGSFETNALISQGLKNIIHGAPGYNQLSYVQREALDMIALKISRILSGNPNEPDHWQDIAGYAHLGGKDV